MNDDELDAYRCDDAYADAKVNRCDWCKAIIPAGEELCRDCWSENNKRLMQDRQDDPDFENIWD